MSFPEVQTPENCLAAVQNDGYALQFVKEQTPEICLAAVKQNGLALQFVPYILLDELNLYIYNKSI